MKTFHARSPLFCLSILVSFLAARVPVSAQLAQPGITRIEFRDGNVVVSVHVPAGICKVTLEGRERSSTTTWEPRAVARIDPAGGHITLELPASRDVEMLRVRGDATEPLPSFFYTGDSIFPGEPSEENYFDGTSPPIFYATTGGLPSPSPTTPSPTPTRAVVESDLWQIRDTTLYFFNQYRGLQVIDIANPDQARIRGALPIPGAGEQMYLLGAKHVVLLAADGCPATSPQSRVIVVNDSLSGPAIVAELPVAGRIVESRLVGSNLYVATQSYRPGPVVGLSAWEWGTQIFAFDLSNPDAPVARNQLWYPGSGHVISASDRLLFVATRHPTDYWRSVVQAIDITAADGTMADYQTIPVAGLVKDKFKLDYRNGIFTSISEDQRGNGVWRLVTKVETFRLSDPRAAGPQALQKLGELEVGRGEQLHATRFDGDRLYIVTFLRIDPLFVVNLADPTAPRVTGELEIPGWSTYIEPLGDRLVAVGIETNRVSVSLFNVTDPAHPTLADRVTLGENYSYSEANVDEKAFNVLANAGLILVPFSGYTGQEYRSSVQLIDLQRDALVKRGVIDHELQPRRATIYGDRIISVSGRKYSSVDATDRDHPVVRGEIALAWPVEQVFLHGNFLVELSPEDGTAPSKVQIVRANAPDVVLSDLVLSNMPIAGATVRGDYLYLLQSRGYSTVLPVRAVRTDPPVPLNPIPLPNLLLTVVDLSQLPLLGVVGQTVAHTTASLYSAQLEAVWPTEGVLVWAGGSQPQFWGPYYPTPLPGQPMIAGGFSPYWGGNSQQLIAFNVTNPMAPAFASETTLSGSGVWGSSFSKAYAAGGLVYISHTTSGYSPYPYPYPPLPPTPLTPVPLPPVPATLAAPLPTGLTAPGGVPPYPLPGSSLRHSYLNVVDYADPTQPLGRTPLSIPGKLAGVSHNGAIVYTTGWSWKSELIGERQNSLSALAYDGASVHRVDSVPLRLRGPAPVLVVGDKLFVGQPGSNLTGATNPARHLVETWTLTGSARFERLGGVELAEHARSIVVFADLLVVQDGNNAINLFDQSDAANLRRIGERHALSCLYYDVQKADGDTAHGLWLPLLEFGVLNIPTTR